MQCPKCGYVRQAGDKAPDYECPRCGVVYAKVRARDVMSDEEFAKSQARAEARLEAEAATMRLATAASPAVAPAKGAMGECEDCGKPVSQRAAACPHCGCQFVVPPQYVVVADVEMRFGSMVVFMVKWAVAAIPAALLLILLGAFVVGMLGGVGAMLGGAAGR